MGIKLSNIWQNFELVLDFASKNKSRNESFNVFIKNNFIDYKFIGSDWNQLLSIIFYEFMYNAKFRKIFTGYKNVELIIEKLKQKEFYDVSFNTVYNELELSTDYWDIPWGHIEENKLLTLFSKFGYKAKIVEKKISNSKMFMVYLLDSNNKNLNQTFKIIYQLNGEVIDCYYIEKEKSFLTLITQHYPEIDLYIKSNYFSNTFEISNALFIKCLKTFPKDLQLKVPSFNLEYGYFDSMLSTYLKTELDRVKYIKILEKFNDKIFALYGNNSFALSDLKFEEYFNKNWNTKFT